MRAQRNNSRQVCMNVHVLCVFEPVPTLYAISECCITGALSTNIWYQPSEHNKYSTCHLVDKFITGICAGLCRFCLSCVRFLECWVPVGYRSNYWQIIKDVFININKVMNMVIHNFIIINKFKSTINQKGAPPWNLGGQ